MRVISLFSGTGAFELGFERNGFRVVGQCEFDPHAQAVLKRHWPDVPLHGDITTLEGDAFGPAEVVVWGSPCQDLSLAGRRAGLKGERSGLFTEGIRFIRELREVTNGEYPRFSVWENVPGALSSNGGHDFRAVLEAFIEAEVPMPRSSKWANAGVVRGNGREVAWRVLDSQHFGVAQRRRRVFVVADFGGHGAAEVLFEREGVSGHPAKGRAAREGAARGAEGRAGDGGVAGTLESRERGGGFPGTDFALAGGLQVAPTVLASWGHHGYSSPRGDGTDPIVPTSIAPADAHGGKDAGSAGLVPVAFAENSRSELRLEGGDGQRTGALSTGGGKPGQGQPVVAFAIQDGRDIQKQQNGLGISQAGGPSYTVDTTGAQAVAFAMRGRAEGNVPEVAGDVANALRGASGGSTRDMVAFAATDYSTGSFAEMGVSGPLTGTPDRSRAATLVNPVTYGVRRLTPRECERLQGLPDDHTRYRPDGGEIADTHRYRLCGNAVTVNVAEWLGGRVAAALAAEELEEVA